MGLAPADVEALPAGVSNMEFKYTDPSPKFDRSAVKGTVASNLSVPDQKNVTALEALAGGRLHQVTTSRIGEAQERGAPRDPCAVRR